ncbi:MAG: lipid-A-disaccharide synthase [Rhodocyclaceae bacterium]
MVAGEASGDLLGAHLISALRRHLPQASFCGIGGPLMAESGLEVWVPAERLAVHGYADALRHYREIAAIRRGALRRLLREPPDAFVGVDAPDFNLWLEHRLKRRGIPAIHYVSPSVWAWRAGRIRRIARSVSHLLALFPFEPAIYAGSGVPVTYVGHPLADAIPFQVDTAATRRRLGIAGEEPVFALLPGSRRAELDFMAATFVQTARLLARDFPGARFLVPLVSRETRERFETAIYRCDARELPLKLLFGHGQDALAACDAALVASGTATLEAALLGKPMVIAYRMSAWSYRLMRRMARQPWFGLPNILAGRFVVPEFIQDEANPENLAQALGNWVSDRVSCARLARLFEGMHRELRRDSAEQAARAILSCLAHEGACARRAG